MNMHELDTYMNLMIYSMYIYTLYIYVYNIYIYISYHPSLWCCGCFVRISKNMNRLERAEEQAFSVKVRVCPVSVWVGDCGCVGG